MFAAERMAHSKSPTFFPEIRILAFVSSSASTLTEIEAAISQEEPKRDDVPI